MANPLSNIYGKVYLKYLWNDDWVHVPWVTPLSCVHRAAPGEWSASLLFEYGEIKWPDSNVFTSNPKRDFNDYFVKIMLCDEDQNDISPFWYGVIPRQSDVKLGATQGGRQIFNALGLEHLLDRRTMTGAYVVNDSQAGAAEKYIDWFPGFNEAIKKGMKGVEGNRSEEFSDNGTFAFSQQWNAKRWNAFQVVNYILSRYPARDNINWTFAADGQYEALFDIEEIWNPQDNISVWKWLNLLIDRRRGLSFYLWPKNGNEADVEIRVFSVMERDVTIGERTLPANNNQTTFQSFATHPERHLIQPIEFIKSTLTRFNTIEVRGERMVTVATYGFRDTAAMRQGWPSLASEIKQYTDTTEEERATDRFAGFFTKFVVKEDWNRRIGDIFSAACNESINLKCDEQGIVKADAYDGPVWKRRQRMEDTMPIEQNYNYSLFPPVHNVVGADVNKNRKEYSDWTALMVFANLPVDVLGGGGPNQIYRLVDHLADNNTGLPNCHVRALDREFGFELQCTPRHVFAREEWPIDANGAFLKVAEPPRLRWKDMGVTAAVKCDARLRVQVDALTDQYAAEVGYRHMTIDVPGAEYWRILKNTVVGLTAAGGLAKCHDSNKVLRDDRDLLDGIAAFAVGWYGQLRQSINITANRVDDWVKIGALVTRVTGDYNEEVNTVVSEISTDFTNGGSVKIQTGWGEYDIMSAILDEKKGIASKRANLEWATWG